MFLKHLSLLIAITFASTADSREPKSALLNPFNIQRDAECSSPGFMCKNCKDLVFCYQLPNGEWEEEDGGTCDEDQTCNDGVCSNIHSSECDPTIGSYTFICNQIGMFPHAFDCKKYHQCISVADSVNPEPLELECPENFSYDPLTTLCRNKLPEDKCTGSLVEPCRSLGQSGPIPGNPSLYFVCLPLETPDGPMNFPQIFHCNGNLVFHNGQCSDPSPEGVDNGECSAIGNFYDPDDCRKYNECSTVGDEPIERTCSTGNRFDGLAGNCVPFTC